MTIYVDRDGGEWITTDVRGTLMAKRIIWEGDHDVRAALYRMPAGMRVEPHRHDKWVSVSVLEGHMLVEQAGLPPRNMPAGSSYFVLPGETHAETAMIDTLVLVVQGEDRGLQAKANAAR